MVARISTVAFHGVEVQGVDVEVSISNGLPAFTIVGSIKPDKIDRIAMIRILIVILIICLFPVTASADSSRNPDACEGDMHIVNVTLTSTDIAKTYFRIPRAYFSRYFDPETKRGKKENFIPLSVLKGDMQPICPTADYATHDSKAASEKVINISIHPSAPEGLINFYRRATEYDYTIFAGVNEAGYRKYLGDKLSGDSLLNKAFFVPPQGYLSHPAFLTCGSALNAKEGALSYCKVEEQLTPFLYLQYSFKPTDNFSNFREIDDRINNFINSLIVKQDRLSNETIVTFDQKQCPGSVRVSIGGAVTMVPRDTDIYLQRGKRLWGMNHPRYGCDINLVENVSELSLEPFSRGHFELVDPNSQFEGLETTFGRYLGIANKEYLRLPDGSQKLDRDKCSDRCKYDEYILDQEKYQTSNGQPILIRCDQNLVERQMYLERCELDYFHSSGLFIKHQFFRQAASDEEVVKRAERKYHEVDKFIQAVTKED